jgi:hypothetical protein
MRPGETSQVRVTLMAAKMREWRFIAPCLTVTVDVARML